MFVEPDAVGRVDFEHSVEADGVVDFGGADAAGLFGGFAGDAAPAFDAFAGSVGEAAFAAGGFDGDDAGDGEFGGFFDGPFEAFEFDEGKVKGGFGEWGVGGEFFEGGEFDEGFAGGFDFGEPDATGVCDFVFLAGFDAEDAGEVVGVFAFDNGFAVADFVDEKAASGHVHSI